MKIKYTKVEIGKGYTWLTLWLMLPDFYTFWDQLGEGDQTYLKMCWEKRECRKIKEFMEGYRLNLCRGSIRFGARQEAPKKKLSWTWFRERVYGIWIELNTPYPKTTTESEIFREVPISRTTHFLSLLQIPSYIPTFSLKDFVTLYILWRDHGKNILE